MIKHAIDFHGANLPNAVLELDVVKIVREPQSESGFTIVAFYSVYASEEAKDSGEKPIKKDRCIFDTPPKHKRHADHVHIDNIMDATTKGFKQSGNVFSAIEHGLKKLDKFKNGVVS